jgi:hypothetical protein
MVGHSENGRHDDWDLAVAITGAKSPCNQRRPVLEANLLMRRAVRAISRDRS